MPSLGTRPVATMRLRGAGPPTTPRARADVAQLVEHITRNDGVGGSSPPVGLGTEASRGPAMNMFMVAA
jgi:hypothetical protein